MKIKSNNFLVQEGATVNLKKWPTLIKSTYHSDGEYKHLLDEHVKKLSELQSLHYASTMSTYFQQAIF
jgi:hypothetical protein